MAKITYYLGAGASFHSCPILDRQAEMMIKLAEFELNDNKYMRSPLSDSKYKVSKEYNFDYKEYTQLKEEKDQILWHIGYFGKKALEFNTIDTYARKLFLTQQKEELRLLKMSVSVFFDLWENFYDIRYKDLSEEKYKPIDYRYTALFSLLLENGHSTQIQMNQNFKFITWNYDLQLEKTFKAFLRDNTIENFDQLDLQYFKFKEDDNFETQNNVFHLNGHRGFFKNKDDDKIFELNASSDITRYWAELSGLLEKTKVGSADFDSYIKYSWEHNLENNFYQKIKSVLKNTEILIIVGYSFPPFNREVDQLLFSSLSNRLKKIVYQDPKASSYIIESLFEYPNVIKDKIEIINEPSALNWFNLPNEHFISQRKIKIRHSGTIKI